MKLLMQLVIVTILLQVTCCNNQGLNEEQRRQLKEDKQNRKIQRVSEVDILNAAKEYALKQLASHQEEAISANIRRVILSDSISIVYDKRLQEAYIYAIERGLPITDNIEHIGDDRMIYTKPITTADSVTGFWLVEMDRKEIVKSML